MKMEQMPITVSFKKGLRTDGELEEVTITQANDELRLTGEQAVSLAKTIMAKYSEVFK